MPATSLKHSVQQKAYRLVFSPLMGVVLLALFALVLHGFIHGFSVLLGGLAYGLSNLILVLCAFRFVGAQQMTQFVTAFFMGEMIKLVLSAILFVLIVKYLLVSLLSVLIGFVGAIVSFWIVCFWHFSREPRAQ